MKYAKVNTSSVQQRYKALNIKIKGKINIIYFNMLNPNLMDNFPSLVVIDQIIFIILFFIKYNFNSQII